MFSAVTGIFYKSAAASVNAAAPDYTAATHANWPMTWNPILNHAPSGQMGSLWVSAKAVDFQVLRHDIILSFGGIPLIYLNDEIGALNDYSFRDDPHKAADSHWVHRPVANWAEHDLRQTASTVQSRIYAGLRHLITLRQAQPALSTGVEPVETGNLHVLGFAHYHAAGPLLVLANFSERAQLVTTQVLHQHGLNWPAVDLISASHVALSEPVALSPYQLAWLKPG